MADIQKAIDDLRAELIQLEQFVGDTKGTDRDLRESVLSKIIVVEIHELIKFIREVI